MLPEAHAILGIVAAVYDFDWNDAERLFGPAMARDPISPWVHQYSGRNGAGHSQRSAQSYVPLLLGDTLRAPGRHEESSVEYQRVLELYENY